MKKTETLIIDFLKSQGKPVKRKYLLKYLCNKQVHISDREMREIVETLVCRRGCPILSLPQGYYYVNDANDPLIEQSLSYLKQKARSIFYRASCIVSNCRNEQLNLFEFINNNEKGKTNETNTTDRII